MVLKNPWVLSIGLPIVILLVVAINLFVNKLKYKGGIKVANTAKIKDTVIYKTLKKWKVVTTVLVELSLILSLGMTVVLMARPSKVETVKNGIKKRDIFLCMDVSYSLYEMNGELVESIKAIVEGMEGDRFGISIFNTSTVLYVPMTDDYDFIIEKLDVLKEYFDLQKEYMYNYNDKYMYEIDMDEYNKIREKLDYYDAGTLINNMIRGSSLIGEGLASCLYSFPQIDDSDRTRVIIMSTDNTQEALSSPIIELKEAAQACANHDVKVFGIYPNKENYLIDEYSDYENDINNFRKAVESTGGTFYIESETLTVDDIVKDIQQQEAKEVEVMTITKLNDQPQVFVIILFISLIILFITGTVILL